MKMINQLFERNLVRLSLLMLSLSFVACGDQNEVDQLVEVDETVAINEAEAEAVYEDLDDLALVSLENSASNTGGRIEEEPDDRFCGSMTFEGDKTSGTITIDFGDGCEDLKGNVRKGKVIINYSGGRLVPGSSVVTTLENYSINDIAIEGTRTLVNISESLDDYPTFNITLTGGQITWPDGAQATREVDRVRVWVNAANPLNDEHHVTGVATGTTRNGVNYSMAITDTLVYKRNCRFSRRAKLPVSGEKVITTDERVLTINFGDGECDRLVTVTANGVSKETEVN